MAKRRKKGSRKKARRKGGRRKKAHRRAAHKGKIPLNILERRLGKLARIVKSRGGRLPR